MKVVVLGGAGFESGGIIKDLIDSGVTEIVLADCNMEAAQKRAAELTTAKTRLTAKLVDANDHNSMVETIKGADVAVSALGPFYQYGEKTLKAAIAAKVPYVDINDDYDATVAALKLDEAAKEAGIAAIIGLGVTPGVSNVCVACAAEQLDQVETVEISWIAGAGPGGDAVLLHFFHGVDNKIPVYSNQQYVEESPARASKKLVNFPAPFGPIELPYIGHSELITLPKTIKGIKNVSVRGGVYPSLEQEIVNQLANLELFSRVPVKVNGIDIAPRDFTAAYFETIMEADNRDKKMEEGLAMLPTLEYGSLIVEVEGYEKNLPTKYTYIMNADLCDTTEWPASIGAQFLAKGQISQKGVLAPEQCINPALFFAELKKRGITISESKVSTRVL